jgi:hypothetical protein
MSSFRQWRSDDINNEQSTVSRRTSQPINESILQRRRRQLSHTMSLMPSLLTTATIDEIDDDTEPAHIWGLISFSFCSKVLAHALTHKDTSRDRHAFICLRTNTFAILHKSY